MIAPGARLLSLRHKLGRQFFVEVIEHRRRRFRLHGEVFLDGGVDLGGALRVQPFLVDLVPGAGFREILAEAGDRLAFPLTADLGVLAIAASIVDRRVIAQAVGESLDDGAPAAGACPFDGAARRVSDGDDVVAVDLLAGKARRDGFLRQGLRPALRRARHRDRPLVVGDDEHGRQLHSAREIDRLVEVALRGGSIAKTADGNTLLIPQFHRQGHADRMERLAADGNADREIPRRSGTSAAPLVAAPVEQDLGGRYPAPELGRLVPIGWQEHVIAMHGAGDADADRFLADTGRIGAEPSRALQGDGLGIERPRPHHGAVEGQQHHRIAGEFGQRLGNATLRVEKLAIRDLE